MAKCSFCGIELPKGTGKMYVKKDGKIFFFCSRRCEKNLLKLKRVPRETRWTEEYARLHKKNKKMLNDKENDKDTYKETDKLEQTDKIEETDKVTVAQ